MHGRFIKQQDLSQFFRGIGASALCHNRMQFLEQVRALNVDQLLRVGGSRHECQHQLDEELVALMLGGCTLGEPILELFMAGLSDRVDTLFGSRILLDGLFDYPAAFLHAAQSRVNLSRLDVPILLAADDSLKRRAQFVPMARSLSKQP